jgi:hypothetical protein
MGLREMHLDRAQDLPSTSDGVGFWLERHRRMAALDRRDELEEVAVPDDNVVQPTAVDVASLSGER